MRKKIISILITIVAIVAILLGSMISYAKYAQKPLTVNLSKTQNGVGYGVFNPKNGGEYIWNIVPQNTTESRILYCVNAEYGQTWFDNGETSTNVTYNYQYDLQSERDALAAALANNTVVDAGGVIAKIIETGGGQYEQLLWLFDNMHIPGKTNKDELLEKIGILKDEEGYYTEVNGQKFDCYSVLTEEDIIAIQKVAIWKFTNGGAFNLALGQTNWLWTTTDGEAYSALINQDTERNEQAVLLYNYLVTSAEANKGQYIAANEYAVGQNKITVNTQGLETAGTNYVLQTKIVNGKYITGPIKITAENNNPYEIVLSVTDSNGTVDFDYTDENGIKIQNATIKSLVGRNGGFYISTDISTIDQLNISISVTQEKTTKTLWLAGTEDQTGKITLIGEQPIVEVKRTKPTETTNFIAKPFDLALRKYITAIKSGETVTTLDTRLPDYGDLTALKTGTTAEYKHRKDPVQVKDGDIITYTIAIYNEGVKAGYASKIIDQLPRGLIVSNNLPETVTSKDSEGNVRNTYKIEWDQLTSLTPQNQIILTIADAESAVSLQPFTGSKLDYETIEIECIVAQKPATDKDTTLTNVAWIAEAYDSDAQKEVSTTGTTDRDSQPQTSPNVNQDIDKTTNYTGNESNKEDLTDSSYYYAGEQDDDDFEKVIIKKEFFDLSLRKFITGIGTTELKDSDGNYTRQPNVDVTPLKNGETTATYTHSKQPVTVQLGDKVIYTIRVYNEGSINGYAMEVKDYLPKYLTFDENSEINKQYGWQKSEDGRVVTTTYLSDTELEAFNGTELDYADLKIECIVSESTPLKEKQTNIAEITKYQYNGKEADKDIDSTADNMVEENWLPADENLPTYKDEEMNNSYVPGNEDDDDFEKIYVKEFDLALRKFITKVQNREITSRVPQVKIEDGTISYEHTKDTVIVHVGDVVIYTIRIYNEGETSGYASEITDDIPEYLEYLPEDSTNVEYMWKMYDENGNETENVEEAVKVKTTYLSKDNNEENLIEAFDGTTLDYKDIKIAFKVKNPNSNEYIITNHAQISDDTDSEGNPVNDKDSEPDEWNEGEDDQDIENIKVQYFDLSLLKFVSKVILIEDGKQKITETGYNGHEDPEPVVKVELHRKKLNDVIVKFGYGITITNEGDIAGYATEITDYVPEGLKFDPTDNPEWTDEGNNVISTRQLEETLLQPGESKTIEVVFTWINDPNNMALKTNTAEISEDKNEYDVPDRDSTPDNKEDGEDDIDIAKVILAVSTGAGRTYFMLTLGLLTVVLVGIILIKKFVL